MYAVNAPCQKVGNFMFSHAQLCHNYNYGLSLIVKFEKLYRFFTKKSKEIRRLTV